MTDKIQSRILVVEDEATLRAMLAYALQAHGFMVDVAENVEDARLIIKKNLPDLILLDWMLPNVSGVDFAAILKKKSRTCLVPIILLTAKNTETDKLKGFEVGVDDFVSKPFSTKELLARINAVLRRSGHDKKKLQISFGQLIIDTVAKRVMVEDRRLKLSPIEYKLLVFLSSHPDRAYSRDQLLSHVWGRDVYLDERTVDVQLRRLRSKLKPYGYDRLIQTVRGEGYRFSEYDES